MALVSLSFGIIILQAAGITKPTSDMGISAAEEALEQLKNRLTSLERELQDAKFKVTKISILFHSFCLIENLRTPIVSNKQRAVSNKFSPFQQNKMTNERIRLTELMPQSSPLRTGENGQISNGGSSSPLTAFDR